MTHRPLCDSTTQYPSILITCPVQPIIAQLPSVNYCSPPPLIAPVGTQADQINTQYVLYYREGSSGHVNGFI